ncbi:MAG TPA: phosphate acyltransferase, partial [Alphaproteobacteria bacterium]|nr:phosphate acyltransferase [Alphaproteobacteria bacterium]
RSMADKPIIFAMANPDPEITPEEVAEIRNDAIMATGRSDYPNQINNVLGFPYLFRGALDVRATTINEAMKSAAAQALAELAREDVPDEVAAAYAAEGLRYGPEYVIPKPFDPRLIVSVPMAVAKAAVESGVASRPIADFDSYARALEARLDPTATHIHMVQEQVKASPQRMVFAEGEEEQVIRAALQWHASGFGTPVLIGHEDRVNETMARIGLSQPEELEIHNARFSQHNKLYTESLYKRLQRQGFLFRDCQRMVNQDRNVFAACMIAHGHSDAMITGVMRNYHVAYADIRRVLDPRPGQVLFGLSIVVASKRTVFIADSTVHELPSSEMLANIACQGAVEARAMGHEPRVALLSCSNFGNPPLDAAVRVREAIEVLNSRDVDFEYEGEVSADVALNEDLRALYPFSRLSEPANVLVMPDLHSANIASKLLQELGGATLVGPLLMGLEKPAQIVQIGATVADIVNMAKFAAHDSIREQARTAP